jgi:DNA-binding transcriptional ArsR family regulator
MDDIPEMYNLETIEQLRAVSDRLRVRIFEALGRRPMTVAQLSDQLGLAHAKVHYHVRELERVGLVRLVEMREKGGILEKYYRAVARDLTVAPTLLRSIPPDEGVAALGEFLQWTASGFLRAFRQRLGKRPPEGAVASLNAGTLFLTHDEVAELLRQMHALTLPYAEPRGVPGEREHAFAQLLYTELPQLDDAEEEQEQSAPAAGAPGTRGAELEVRHAALDDVERTRPVFAAPTPSSRPAPPGPSLPSLPPPVRRDPKRRRVIAAGTVSYSRADLEQMVKRGEQINILAIGWCSFADDIPAELADRAIAHFRLRGALSASPGVRAVLERKEQEG